MITPTTRRAHARARRARLLKLRLLVDRATTEIRKLEDAAALEFVPLPDEPRTYAPAKVIRAWAAAEGIDVKERGIIPAAVRDAHHEATNTERHTP